MSKTRRAHLAAEDPVRHELEELYGPFAARHHARYHEPDMPYHIVARALQGFALLTPTAELNALIAGIIGRAQTIYTTVQIFAYGFLSNHFHLMLQGCSHEVPAFVGYIKKEITRRLGPQIGWQDTMWSEGYISTALPTAESQVRCLDYLLSQGTKEGLVCRPEQWPGLHIAKHLLLGEKVVGTWVNGTRLGKARWKERQKPVEKQRELSVDDYTETYEVEITPVPPWNGLSESERRAKAVAMAAEISERARIARNGRPSLGVEAVLEVPRTTRWSMPTLPWFEERRRMITWSDRNAPETRSYLRRYWAFQEAFRAASDDYLDGNVHAAFPEGSFRPPVFASRLGEDPPEPELAAA
jgi:REP element-mobilizing transposase RayT